MQIHSHRFQQESIETFLNFDEAYNSHPYTLYISMTWATHFTGLLLMGRWFHLAKCSHSMADRCY